jgi:hypothetical protein
VLAAAAVTNATIPDGGPTTVVTGDVGVSPLEAITGFGPPSTGRIVDGTPRTDPGVDDAQNDLTTAYNVAAALPAQGPVLAELDTLNLGPGVYAGGALNLADNGTLILSGNAESVWVFKAASSLVINSGATVRLEGGASVCNVFWQVGSSATLVENSTFVGTIMANASIFVGENATVEGRLLARTAAVTLIDDTITRPSGCSPDITSGAPSSSGTVGTTYPSHTVTATGSPTPTYSVTEGDLPTGLELSPAGGLTGTPTTPGTYTFTVTANNGHFDDDSETYTITINPAEVAPPVTDTPTGSGTAVTPGTRTGTPRAPSSLAATGAESSGLVLTGGMSLLAGVALAVAAATRRRHRA